MFQQASTNYSCFKAREKGVYYHNEIRKEQKKKVGLVIEVPLDDDSQDNGIPPLTATTSNSFLDDTTNLYRPPPQATSLATSNKTEHKSWQDKQVLLN